MISHHVFASSLRPRTSNEEASRNGAWGGRGGRFGVYGNSRSLRCLWEQDKSLKHKGGNNRTRSAYRKQRSQTGRSNIKKQKNLTLLKPESTIPKKPKSKFNVTQPIKKDWKRPSRPHTTGSISKDKSESLESRRRRLQTAASPTHNDAARFHLPRVVESEQSDQDHPIFNKPTGDTRKFFETMTHSRLNQPLLVPSRSSNLVANPRSKAKYLTTAQSAYKLHEQTETRQLLSPGKKRRILENQKRINLYVQNQEQFRRNRERNNVRATGQSIQDYTKQVRILENFRFSPNRKRKVTPHYLKKEG